MKLVYVIYCGNFLEVADAAIDYDQKVKIPLYAKAGIVDYWIFNLLDNCL